VILENNAGYHHLNTSLQPNTTLLHTITSDQTKVRTQRNFMTTPCTTHGDPRGLTARPWGHCRPVANRQVKYLPWLWVFATAAAMSVVIPFYEGGMLRLTLVLRFALTCWGSRDFWDFVGIPYFTLSSSGFLLGWARLHGDFWGRERQGCSPFRLFLFDHVLRGFKEGLRTWQTNLYPAAVVLTEQASYLPGLL